MKNMRKLVPAFAMLMVAAIMMSTASFAWFSMNTTATANGMQITAKSDGGLAIAAYLDPATPPASNSYGSSADVAWTNGATAVSPTSHSGSKWYSASAGTVTTPGAVADKDGVVYTEVTTGSLYYHQSKWSIKTLDDTNAYNVSITAVTVSGTFDDAADADANTVNLQKALAKALRVAVTDGTNWYYFAPAYSSGDTLYYVANPAADNAEQVKAGGVKTQYGTSGANAIVCGATGLSQVVLQNVTDEGAPLDVYVYFEGEDENCISKNAVDLRTITVNLSFAATKVTP